MRSQRYKKGTDVMWQALIVTTSLMGQQYLRENGRDTFYKPQNDRMK